MKKNVKRIFIAACITAVIALAFTGCAYPNTKVKGQDTSYAVFSNGGSAVQYGDYVYFINGTEATFDGTKENRWGEVVKGGIYRVKIENGKAVTEKDADNVEYKAYRRSGDDYLDIKKVEVTNFNEDEKKITMIDGSYVERVVPKYVRSDNNAYAGIFIYDGWIYYSSPNTRKDKTGVVNYDLSDFFRTKVDGTGTQRLYSSKEAVTDYNFYNYGGKVYLVCAEGTDLISVSIGKSAGKVARLSDGITEVYFPRKEAYYKGISQDTAADYVYYVRAHNGNDNSAEGNVLEFRRPDLKEETGIQVFDNNSTYGIAGVDGNTLFYYETPAAGTGTKGRKDLYAQPQFNLWAKIALNSLLPENEREDISGVPAEREEVIIGVGESMTQVTPFNNLPKTAAGDPVGYSAVAMDGSDLKVYTRGVYSYVLHAGAGNIVKAVNATVYFSGGSGELFSVFADAGQKSRQLTKGSYYLSVDIAADMFWFFGNTLEQSDFDIELRENGTISANYMFVKLAPTADINSDEFFIGEVGPDELPPEEE